MPRHAAHAFQCVEQKMGIDLIAVKLKLCLVLKKSGVIQPLPQSVFPFVGVLDSLEHLVDTRG